jgi:hypothetical protein
MVVHRPREEEGGRGVHLRKGRPLKRSRVKISILMDYTKYSKINLKTTKQPIHKST